MGNELGSGAEMQRLSELYRAMSDGELLRLAERPEDLTDAAQQVLRGEMSSRGLQVEAAPVAGFAVEPEQFAKSSSFAPDEYSVYTRRSPDLKPAPAAKGLAKGTVVLTTFNDAIAAGEACDLLEAEGFEIDVRDVAAQAGGGSFYGGPPVALQVIVQQRDLRCAMSILQEKMGLFPGQEVEVADEAVDDGTTAALGYFGHRSDAEEVARVLEAAGVWHRIAANAEGSVADENCFSLEVKEIDLVRAGEIVERSMELPEG
jgi:hypothetical protein